MPIRIDPKKVTLQSDGTPRIDDSSVLSRIDAIAQQLFSPQATTNSVCNGENLSCSNTSNCTNSGNTRCSNSGACFTPSPPGGQN